MRLRLIVKKAPAVYEAEQYRVNVSEDAGTRGIDFVVHGDSDKLREFLQQKFELDKAQVSRVVESVVAHHVGASELVDWDLSEVRALSRRLDREERLAAAGKTVQPREATQ